MAAIDAAGIGIEEQAVEKENGCATDGCEAGKKHGNSPRKVAAGVVSVRENAAGVMKEEDKQF